MKKTQTVLALWEGINRTIMSVPIVIKFKQTYTLLADCNSFNLLKSQLMQMIKHIYC